MAKFFVLSITLWAGTCTRKINIFLFFLVCVTGYYLIRSPIVLVSLVNIALIKWFYFRERSGKFFKRIFYVYIVLPAILVLVFFVVKSPIFQTRITAILQGGDASFVIRLVVPVYVAKEVLFEHPVLGMGLSGTDTIADLIEKVFIIVHLNPEKFSDILQDALFNSFWLFWISFGFVGGLMVIFSFLYFVKKMNIYKAKHVFIFLLIFSNFIDTINGGRFWFTFFVYCVMTSVQFHRQLRNKNMERPRQCSSQLCI